MNDAPHLLVGPLLRWVDTTRATVWVETDRPGTVAVLGHEAPTFTVHGHHYAIVTVTGLSPGTEYRYGVELGGHEAWPAAGAHGQPPSVIRTHADDDRWQIVFGSCRRVEEDQDDPHPDALRVFGERLAVTGRRPDLLLLLGDQVYACELPAATRAAIRARRDVTAPPGEEIADFEEFALLYRESWTNHPAVRWLLSTVPSAMIFDDHDIIDDWNISASWVADMRQQPWWRDRIVGGLMSYWLYQHLGNAAPEQLANDELLAELVAASADGGDAGDVLERFAEEADRGPAGTPGARWSFARDLGRTRLAVVDSRNGRILGADRRDMLDAGEWSWLDQQATGDVDHLLLASSLPVLLPEGIHYAQTWNEAVCAGAWGRVAARAGEAVRRAIDLEHWSAFTRGFQRLCRLVGEVAEGRRGPAPSTVLLLSGDVHYVYMARARTGAGQRSAVWQLTCSPMHYVVERPLKAAMRVGASVAGTALGRVLRGVVRAPTPDLDWDVVQGPEFGSYLATLDLHGRAAHVTFERADRSGLTPRVQRALTA